MVNNSYYNPLYGQSTQYYNPSYNPANGYIAPNYVYPSYLNNQSQQPRPQQNIFNWVQGEAAAKAVNVLPGQTALLMDSEDSVFYIKTTDESGMPLPLRIFDYKERETKEVKEKEMPVIKEEAKEVKEIDMSNYITREEFEKRINGIKLVQSNGNNGNVNNKRKGNKNESSVQFTK